MKLSKVVRAAQPILVDSNPRICVKPSHIHELDELICSPKKIIDSARRTLFISRKLFRSGKSHSNLLSLSFTLNEDLKVLVEACGNGRLKGTFSIDLFFRLLIYVYLA